MARSLILCCFLLSLGARVGAAPGDPVVGQIAAVDLSWVAVRWEGTDDDRYHRDEGATLGGFTLFGSLSRGGPVIARLELPWPPAENPGSRPLFAIPGVPHGRYFVVAVRGLVAAPTQVPSSAWTEVVVGPGACGAAPGPPSLHGQGPIPGGSLEVSLGWYDGPGCTAEYWEIVAGYSPGASDAGRFIWPGRSFAGLAPPNIYFVRVHAINRHGRSAPSNELRIEVAHPSCTGPGAVPNLTAAVDGNQVTLNWGEPSPGSRPVSMYRITAGSGPGLYNLATIQVGSTPRSFTTVAPPGRYYVRVWAGNGCGSAVGAPSNEVIVDVP